MDESTQSRSSPWPLSASLAVNADIVPQSPTTPQARESPAKRALRASIHPAGLENASSGRTLRSSTRSAAAAPGTPLATARYSVATTPSQAQYDRAPPSGRASPVRSDSPTKPRAKLTEGVSSRFRSSPKKAATASPEKRGLGIAMGLPGVLPEDRPRTVGTPVSVKDLEGDEELEDSSFVYNDPDEGDSMTLASSASGEFGSDDQSESVMVHVRLRPPKPFEKCAWVPNSITGSLSLDPTLAAQRVQQGAGGPYTFDGLLTGSANRPVYISVARPLIRSALDGYDAVIFAYGQTASGKTFTLSGDERGAEQGIIPRAVRDIFRGIKQSSARREYLLRASYLEIWNENVKDLLEPANVPQVRDDRRKGGKGTFVHPLREEIVTSPGQVRDLLARGQANRHVGATDWNERSSRSHTCFKVTIESWERDSGQDDVTLASRLGKKVRVSELSLIDLAGSEKYVSQGSDRRAEGAHINKSLLTLGKVIFALSEKSTKGVTSAHVPYRDSKLTRILQNSLSGNARVAVVCTINPSPSAVDESLSTLSFAKRVKKVSLHAKRNEIEGDAGGLGGAEAQALIVRYRDEARALRKQVAELQGGAATPRINDDLLQQLQDRLDTIGNLVVRGGGEGALDEDDSDDDGASVSTVAGQARPVSPMRKQKRAVEFSDPPHVLQEKLYLANKRIEQLQKKLSSRPSLPASCTSEADKDALIGRLQQHVKELEMVCEAQAADAPPKIREDVEREWAGKVTALEERMQEKENFIAEMSRECERLKRVSWVHAR